MNNKVFIGSSKESAKLIGIIASWIEKSNLKPIRWDEPTLFEPGDNTIDTLLKQTNECIAGVFVFAEDDQLLSSGENNTQTRGNVLLEFGMFLSKLGRDRAIICVNGNPKVISDLLGVTTIDISDGTMQKGRLSFEKWANNVSHSLLTVHNEAKSTNNTSDIAQTREQMWAIWSQGARKAKQKICAITKTVSKDIDYLKTIRNLKLNNPKIQLFLLAPIPNNTADIENLVERSNAGFEVRLKSGLFQDYPIRYQIVDDELLVFNVPEDDINKDTRRCVTIPNKQFIRIFYDAFMEQWRDTSSIDLFEHIIEKYIIAHLGVEFTNKDTINIKVLSDRTLISEYALSNIIKVGFERESIVTRTVGVNTWIYRKQLKPKNDYFKKYIDTSELFIKGINFGALGNLGIRKTLETSFWPGHTIVTYPSYNDLKKLNKNDLEKSINLDSLIKQTSLMKTSSTNLYIHIPFCKKICEYCAYSRDEWANGSPAKMKNYLNALQKELNFWDKQFSNKFPKISSLYIGGGTPTAISIELLKTLLSTLNDFIAIDTLNIERTCEVNPETILNSEGEEKLNVLMKAGFNRISIGVQTFSDDVNQAVGRNYKKEDALKAIENIRISGFDNINIDLMYGLPKQNMDNWFYTLKEAVELGMPSITLYPFKLKAHSFLSTRHHKTSSWTSESALEFALTGKLFLEEHGYTQQSVYWFVKGENDFQQQSKKYKMENLLGIGSSSYSFIADCQMYNINNYLMYSSELNNGNSPFEFGKHLSKDELKYRFFIFGIRNGFSTIDYNDRFSNDQDLNEFFPIEELLEKKLIEITSDNIYKLSPIGTLFADEIGQYLINKSNSQKYDK